MTVSAQWVRVRAFLDAAGAIVGSLVVGVTVINLQNETRMANLFALSVGLIFVTVAAASIVRRRPAFSTLADRVTLVRAVLGGSCATIVALSLFGSIPTRSWLLIALAVPALLLDAVDGWVARKMGTANSHGARLDMETDAAFLAVLSIPVALTVGPWALAIGAMRYVFLAASWWRPALRQQLSFSKFRRVTAGIQGVVLVVALVPIVPFSIAAPLTMLALALLTWSFGRDIIALERSSRMTRVRASDAIG